MKVRSFLVIFCLLLTGGVFSSCISEDEVIPAAEGKGRVSFSFVSDTGFGVAGTRAVDEAAYKNTANYTVQLFKAGSTEVFKEGSPADFSGEMELDKTSYTVKAFYDPAGVKTAYSSQKGFYVEGSYTFTVSDDNEAVTVTCAPTSARVSVSFSSDMATYFDDYYVDFLTEKLDLNGMAATWNKTTVDPWYLVVGQNETVTATIHLTPNGSYKTSEQEIVKTYALSPNKAWKLSLSPVYDPKEGSLGISITIDETTNDIPVDIVIPSDWV